MNVSLEIPMQLIRRTRWLVPRRFWLRASVIILGVVITTESLRGASLIAKDEAAPEITVPTLGGTTIRLADLRGRIVFLLFGELYNPNSVSACKDLAKILARPAMADVKAAAYLIITQKAPAGELLAEAKKKGVALPVLHDRDRRAFADYRVMVLPSLVVIGPEGKVVLPCAGYPLDFEDMVSDAVLLASGKLSGNEFDRRRSTTTMPGASENQVRAMRLSSLGQQLAKRGSQELAISNFRKAIDLYSDCIPARLGLGTYLLNRNELVGAEKQFRHVLGIQPNSVDGALGLIHIQVIRGGDELKLAAQRLRDLLRRRPSDPKVVYLTGLVAEKSGNMDSALSRYKQSAELLLYGQPSK